MATSRVDWRLKDCISRSWLEAIWWRQQWKAEKEKVISSLYICRDRNYNNAIWKRERESKTTFIKYILNTFQLTWRKRKRSKVLALDDFWEVLREEQEGMYEGCLDETDSHVKVKTSRLQWCSTYNSSPGNSFNSLCSFLQSILWTGFIWTDLIIRNGTLEKKLESTF